MHNDSNSLVDAVNTYHQRLLEMGLTAEHSQQQILQLKTDKNILAAKGCGALGADVLLVVVASTQLEEQKINCIIRVGQFLLLMNIYMSESP